MAHSLTHFPTKFKQANSKDLNIPIFSMVSNITVRLAPTIWDWVHESSFTKHFYNSIERNFFKKPESTVLTQIITYQACLIIQYQTDSLYRWQIECWYAKPMLLLCIPILYQHHTVTGSSINNANHGRNK